MNSLLIKKKNELQKKKKGFTLVELIIVIAIIAILIALAIPKFGTVIENSNQKADAATAKNIATIVAQGIADGTITTTGDEEVTSSTDVGKKLDGTITPKSKNAGSTKTFTYRIGSTGNIVVYYTGTSNQAYPSYTNTVPATP
jgi:type IV pilus assembly protein PilA